MNKRGMGLFLLVTFGLEALGVAGIWMAGDASPIVMLIILAVILAAPALGFLAASKFGEDTGYKGGLWLWPLPIRAAIRLVVVIPASFAAVHILVATVSGISLDWNLYNVIPETSFALLEMTPQEHFVRSRLIVGAFILLNTALGCLIIPWFVLGIESGWRGFLMPRLMHFGRVPMHVISGILWSLWLLPLTLPFANPYENPRIIATILLLGFTLNTFLNEAALRQKNMGLTAMALGLFASHIFGIWWNLYPFSFEGYLMVCWALTVLLFLGAFFAGPLLGVKREDEQEPPKIMHTEIPSA